MRPALPRALGVVLTVLLSSGVFGGCASPPKRTTPVPGYEEQLQPAERGLASWYGEAYRGKTTASGEKFNPDKLTAAHRTLRFGTIAEVRNLQNNRTVVVQITDRGPFIKGRVIDLSEAAARQLGMIKAGVVPVEVRLLRTR